MKTQSKKAKGRALQQWVRDLILKLGKGLKEDDCRSTSMGASGEDVLLSPKAREQFPLSIECKSIAKFAGYKFLDQAKNNSGENHEPIAVVKANYREPIVLVSAEYFFNLIRGK